MDSDSEVPTPGSLFRLRRLQVIDLVGQVFCLLIGGYLLRYANLQRPTDHSVAKLFLDDDFGMLFRLGAWQLLSAVLHLPIWNRIPGRKRGRKLHLIALMTVGAVLLMTWLADDRPGDGLLVVLFGLLFLAPVLAVLYFCVTAVELWKLSGATHPPDGAIPVETSRRVSPQSILLLLTVVPVYRIAWLRTSVSGASVLFFYLAVFGLAGWLLVDYLKARRVGQASRIETVGAVWTGVVLLFYLINQLVHISILLPSSVLSVLLSPTCVLTLWYAARLWRGPLWGHPVPVDEAQ